MPNPTDAMMNALLATVSAGLSGVVPQQYGQAFSVKLNFASSLLTFLDSTVPAVQRDISVNVEWHLFDGSTELQQYQDFFALPDIYALEASFIVGGPVREMTATSLVSPPSPVTVRPTVTLSVPSLPGISLPATDRPGVSVPVPVIPLPTILGLFRHPGFNDDPTLEGKAALIVVPKTSHLVVSEAVANTIDETIEKLSRVDTGVPNAKPLRQLAKFALLVFGLERLSRALRAPNVAVKVRSADGQGTIQNLHDIVLFRHKRRFGGYINYEASHSISSLIFIGEAGSKAVCYNQTRATGTEYLELFVKQALVVLISSLVLEPPESIPEGGSVSSPNDATKFNNEFESVRIGPLPSTLNRRQ